MLVLSVFPGIGLLDRAFEEEGFCVVRGPDLLWGGDIKRFHPPASVFDGVIGGPPCQRFSRFAALVRYNGYKLGENLIPEFERAVSEARPRWFVMENVVEAPIPSVPGYHVHPALLNARWLGEEQSRLHRFSFGTLSGWQLDFGGELTLIPPTFEYRVCASDGRRALKLALEPGPARQKSIARLRQHGQSVRTLERACELQGVPADFFADSPFRVAAAWAMLGNGVSYPMGRALARAVRRAVAPANGDAPSCR